MLPVGAVALWPLEVPPAGWLFWNGAAVSRSTYELLFGVYGTNFGAGDGVTTFNVPNVAGMVLLGAGVDEDEHEWVVGDVGGENTHTMTLSELYAHSHQYTRRMTNVVKAAASGSVVS